MVVKPDPIDVKNISSKMFGFQPHEMCEVLQYGLEFWSVQRQNESMKHVNELRNMKQRLQESGAQSEKLSRVRQMLSSILLEAYLYYGDYERISN